MRKSLLFIILLSCIFSQTMKPADQVIIGLIKLIDSNNPSAEDVLLRTKMLAPAIAASTIYYFTCKNLDPKFKDEDHTLHVIGISTATTMARITDNQTLQLISTFIAGGFVLNGIHTALQNRKQWQHERKCNKIFNTLRYDNDDEILALVESEPNIEKFIPINNSYYEILLEKIQRTRMLSDKINNSCIAMYISQQRKLDQKPPQDISLILENFLCANQNSI